MLSNQYCPFVVGPASKIDFIMLFAGSYATGSGGTGLASPVNAGVPRSTAGGMPGTYSAYASAPPPSSTVADAATAARRRRATHLLALAPILDPSLLGAVSCERRDVSANAGSCEASSRRVCEIRLHARPPR